MTLYVSHKCVFYVLGQIVQVNEDLLTEIIMDHKELFVSTN